MAGTLDFCSDAWYHHNVVGLFVQRTRAMDVRVCGCNPRPSRGRKRFFGASPGMGWDATRAPRGVGNLTNASAMPTSPRCNPRPSRGRKQNRFEQLLVCFRCNPRPSRGRKPCLPRGRGSAQRCNPRPSRGRKLSRKLQCRQHRGCNPRPSRGRKPCSSSMRFLKASMQPAPLAGSETFPSMASRVTLCDATRAPRGVGNFSMVRRSSARRCNPRPSRGRKQKYQRLF